MCEDEKHTGVIFQTCRTLDGGSRSLPQLLEHILQQEQYKQFLERGSVFLRLACDGAKISKLKDSVRVTVKIIWPDRDNLSPEVVKSSPDDEITLLFFMGKAQKFEQANLQNI